MFFSVEALLLTKNLSVSTHKASFGEHFIKTGIFPKDMGKDLSTAMEKRQLGDYESIAVITTNEAEIVLTKGESFCAKIKDHIRCNADRNC